jgi:hypothetical protein
VSRVRLDLNQPDLQRQLCGLEKADQRRILNSLRKLLDLTWEQVYRDKGLRWEAILSRRGANGERLYSLRLGRGLRAVALRDGDWLRLISLHPDHDSAYR